MFDDSRPSTIRINDIEQVDRLREYLGRPSRQRPLAVATPKWGHDEPVTSAERLVGRGFDVAIVESMSVLTSLNEHLPYELRIRQCLARVNSTAVPPTEYRRSAHAVPAPTE